MLYIGLEPANEHVAATLRVEPGQDVVARRKLMFANGVPVRIATSFFRSDLFGDTRMVEPEFVRPSLQAAIEDLGYTFGRAEESLIARRPTLFERETLDLEPDEWIVQVLRTSYSTEGTPVHALETICSATRQSFPSARSPAPTSSDLPKLALLDQGPGFARPGGACPRSAAGRAASVPDVGCSAIHRICRNRSAKRAWSTAH